MIYFFRTVVLLRVVCRFVLYVTLITLHFWSWLSLICFAFHESSSLDHGCFIEYFVWLLIIIFLDSMRYQSLIITVVLKRLVLSNLPFPTNFILERWLNQITVVVFWVIHPSFKLVLLLLTVRLLNFILFPWRQNTPWNLPCWKVCYHFRLLYSLIYKIYSFFSVTNNST